MGRGKARSFIASDLGDVLWPSFIGDLIKKISPQSLMERNVRVADGRILAHDERTGSTISVPLPKAGKVFVVSVGKAAAKMYTCFHHHLYEAGADDPRAIVLSPNASDLERPSDALFLKGNHPFPDSDDVENTNKIRDLLSGAVEDDLIVVLLSGGSSSLLFYPREGVPVDIESSLIKDLMLAGADITELNTVRTYLSEIKGGGLLHWTGKAEVMTLIISDVLGDDPRFVGSGPTVPWEPERTDVLSILRKYHIDPYRTSKVSRLPERGIPAAGKTYDNIVIANNDSAILAASGLFNDIGFKVITEEAKYSGEARDAARTVLSKARMSMDDGSHGCYISGGETTVSVKGKGRGGRNLEMALSLIGMLYPDEECLCLSTDGMDGTSGLAGAWVCNDTGSPEEIRRALDDNDSGGFFESHKGGVRTGPTGQNLGDLFILLRAPRRPSPDHPRPASQR